MSAPTAHDGGPAPASVDVAIVGGGPAGLAAAVALRRSGCSVTVLEREDDVGGIARHTEHTGYGLREFRRVLRGPEYARRWADRVQDAGVDVRTRTTVTGWAEGAAATRTLALTSPSGLGGLRADAVILATGTRERPRAARLVPGSRPLGVLTTGALQRLAVASPQIPAADGSAGIGRMAVIVGAEHVSFSAVLTLHHAGCRPVAMTTEAPRHQSTGLLRLATASRHRVPVLTRTAVTRIVGRGRVEAVELTDLTSGAVRTLACDTVVFSGDWFPEHELARRGAVPLDPGTRGPSVDGGLRTAVRGVFAAGNLLHGAETAAVCAADGAWVARAVGDWLQADATGAWPPEEAVTIECEAPLRWVSPNRVAVGSSASRAVPSGHLLARSDEFGTRTRIVVHQGDRELWSGRVGRVVPARPVRVPAGWLARVEPGAPVRLAMTG